VTLIELVLTLTILALAGALVAGALSASLRTWRVGFTRGREELVARIALERITGQLRSAIPAAARQGSEEAVAFEAHEDSLHFVTVPSGGGAPLHVSYSLVEAGGKRALVYRELPWPDKDFFGEGRPRREEVVPEITGLKVTVSRCPEEGEPAPNVVESPWKPADLCLPGTVEIEITVPDGAGESTYRVSLPLAVVSAS
jgi:hypothetical protein